MISSKLSHLLFRFLYFSNHSASSRGIPVALFLAKTMTKKNLQFFFEGLREKIGFAFCTRAIVSDGDKIFYNSWVEVMCYSGECIPEPQWLICLYHQGKTWAGHYKQISDIEEERNEIKQLLNSLLHCLNEERFDRKMVELKSKLGIGPYQAHRNKFATYIAPQLERAHEWAMLHRIKVGPTTDNFTENVNS